jgi:hypothetical protein
VPDARLVLDPSAQAAFIRTGPPGPR